MVEILVTESKSVDRWRSSRRQSRVLSIDSWVTGHRNVRIGTKPRYMPRRELSQTQPSYNFMVEIPNKYHEYKIYWSLSKLDDKIILELICMKIVAGTIWVNFGSEMEITGLFYANSSRIRILSIWKWLYKSQSLCNYFTCLHGGHPISDGR